MALSRIIHVDPHHPDREMLKPAANCLREGGLVAFPTETVYGLGANALSPEAISKIYAAKKRPATHPLIVHVASIEQAKELVTDWPPEAQELAQAFWPGPLTLILPKKNVLPDMITSGLLNVGLRMPSHPVALALIEEAQCPVVAPSANPYTQISPTSAQHVITHLIDTLDYVIDAGPTPIGIESTVLTLAEAHPQILRPGMVDLESLKVYLPDLHYREAAKSELGPFASMPSPGMSLKHYSPRARVILLETSQLQRMQMSIISDSDASSTKEKVGWILMSHDFGLPPSQSQNVITLSDNPCGYAANIYSAFHAMDDAGCRVIYVQAPPKTQDWDAIWDRLARASS